MDEERVNNTEENNKGGQFARSFGRINSDAKSIRDRINNSKGKNRNAIDSNSNTSLGEDAPGAFLPKERLNNRSNDSFLNNVGNTLNGASSKVKSTITNTTKNVSNVSAFLGKFTSFLANGGWIPFVIVFAVVLIVLVVVFFGQMVSNFSMKYGITGEEAYNMMKDGYQEGQTREQIDGIFTSQGDDVCGKIGFTTKISILFGNWSLGDSTQLCLYLKRLLENTEKSTDIKTISPGYLFNALYYAYDSQNLDENGEQYIKIPPALDEKGNLLDIATNDFDALSTLIATKIYGNTSSDAIKTIEKLFDNYFYHENYPYLKWEIVGYTDDEEPEPIYDCVSYNTDAKDYIDEDKFKLYLRYGDGPNISKDKVRGVSYYYQRDKNDKSSYSMSDSICWYPNDEHSTSVQEVLDGRTNPDLSKYEMVANLNFEDKEIPTITVDTGTYGYDSGFIYQYYPRYIPKYTISKVDPYVFDYMTPKDIEAIIDNISSRQDYTNYLLGYPNTVKTTIGSNFFSSGGSTCGYNINGETVNDIKVRLLHAQYNDAVSGVTPLSPIEGQELIDFEKYIMGVVYAEIGNTHEEAIKAQAVAARSYILANYHVKNENGVNIIEIENSTFAQTYCDPDKGCVRCLDSQYYKRNDGRDGNGVLSVYTAGTQPSGSTCTISNSALSSDSKIRTATNQVVGQILKVGDTIAATGYRDTHQNRWKDKAKNGTSYEDILAQEYTDTTLSKSECSFASGEWTTWTQLDPRWSNVVVGNGHTVGELGCYMTTIAMLVADTAGEYLPADFNPGTFAKKLQATGHFLSDGSLTGGIPSYVKVATGDANLDVEYLEINLGENESYESKVEKIASYLNQGYKILLRVKSETSREEYYRISGYKTWWAYAQHWVYVTGVDGLDIHMADPGSSYEIVRSNPYYLNSGIVKLRAVKINK